MEARAAQARAGVVRRGHCGQANVNLGGDKHTCERRDLDFHWLRPVGKPWRGPLPPARVSPRVSLGDVPATDYRHGMGGSVLRLSDLNGACVVPPGARSSLVREPPPQGKTKGIRCDRWFKKRIPCDDSFLVPRRLGCRGRSGSQPAFCVTQKA
jgi:hypothetical protein